ncbi:MAG: hypothetical protein KKE64_00225, partial [Candidatus Omnitrophica bacterium]|nr:hypothetical protein [Candidatus Omnitrophota bacterium]
SWNSRNVFIKLTSGCGNEKAFSFFPSRSQVIRLGQLEVSGPIDPKLKYSLRFCQSACRQRGNLIDVWNVSKRLCVQLKLSRGNIIDTSGCFVTSFFDCPPKMFK